MMYLATSLTVGASRVVSGAIAIIAAFAVAAVLSPSLANAQGSGRGKGNSAQQRGKGSQAGEKQGGHQSGAQRNDADRVALTPSQAEQMVRMLEEEKLAHDVYLTLARSSGLQIFNTIARAESQHMRAVEQLIPSHLSATAVKNLPIGNFSNPQFQALYKSLTAAGSSSPLDALMIGAKIEEMDIRDLRTLLLQNPPREVARVLEHLQNASANHLRAFVGAAKQLGGAYTPEFLNQVEFQEIVNSENGRQGNEQFNKAENSAGKGKSSLNGREIGPPAKNANRSRGPARSR